MIRFWARSESGSALSIKSSVGPLVLLVALSLLAVACASTEVESTVTPASAPVPLTAVASVYETNTLVAHIEGTLDGEGSAYIEYWAPGVERLRSAPVASNGASYSLIAVRLRPSTDYNYIVLGANAAGDVALGPTGTFTTGELPGALADATFDVLRGSPTHDLTFLEFRLADFLGFAAFDEEGRVVWYYEGPEGEQPYLMDRRPNGNVVYIPGHKGGTTGMGLVEVTPAGEEVARLVDECSPFGPIHHEVEILEDGRVMYLSREVRRPGYGNPPAPQEGDTIGIWDPANGRNEIVWNIFDFISPEERTVPDSNRTLPGNPLWGGCERDGSVQDWSHGESLSVAPDGSVLASFRHLNQIVSISPDFQSVQWRLGGPGGQFDFPRASDLFYHQHSIEALPNGNVLMFDNGNYRPEDEDGSYSRALELSLDFERMTATKVWEFRRDPDLFSICCSSVERLDNGNTLVVYGSIPGDLCCRPYYITEVDAKGDVVWEVVHMAEGKSSQQRVYAADSIMGERKVGD